jgi:excisionase family DNA binding protein
MNKATLPMARQSMTVTQAAAAAGCSSTTIYRWIRAGDIQAYRIGHGVRIPVTEVERLVQGVPIPTTNGGSDATA